ncbi:hypothetical protein V6N11_045331 [Hibiscus sabdariffa]|uniref:Uncharacterized protein n=1 Tax=Hibiscus sabdariffa TaxID=183260 RepID=A0ABR2Q183_9ROSI
MLNPSAPVAQRTRSRTEAHLLKEYKRKNAGKVVAVEEEGMEEPKAKKPRPSFVSQEVTGKVHSLYEKPGAVVEIQQRKPDARVPADICSLYDDDDKEKDEDDDDSMEYSDEDLTSMSGEDNDELADLDYCEEVEERKKEKKRKRNRRCSSGSENDDDGDLVCLNDSTSSYNNSSKGKKGAGAAASPEKLQIPSVLADTVLNKEETENNLLPLNFSSGVEDTITPQNVGFDYELDSLWTEMQFCLASNEIGSTKPSMVEIEDAANVSEVKQDRASLCRQGDHELVLDEEIGIICKFCSFVKLEIKHVASPFLASGKEPNMHTATLEGLTT